MNRIRKLLTIAAVLLVVMALVPVATASSGEPIRASGPIYFDGGGWVSSLSGDLDCTGYETSEIRIVGPEPLVTGTMHWIGVLVLTCAGGTITIQGDGHWSFANSTWGVNGEVVDATAAYEYLIGASAHQKGTVDMSQFPAALTGTMHLRIN